MTIGGINYLHAPSKHTMLPLRKVPRVAQNKGRISLSLSHNWTSYHFRFYILSRPLEQVTKHFLLYFYHPSITKAPPMISFNQQQLQYSLPIHCRYQSIQFNFRFGWTAGATTITLTVSSLLFNGFTWAEDIIIIITIITINIGQSNLKEERERKKTLISWSTTRQTFLFRSGHLKQKFFHLLDSIDFCNCLYLFLFQFCQNNNNNNNDSNLLSFRCAQVCSTSTSTSGDDDVDDDDSNLLSP